MNEFALIQKYFAAHPLKRLDVIHGIGDDAAIVHPASQQELVITTDTLVADIHFFSDLSPADIGHKALAVNLSDLAAMGAKPAWVTLALTLPESNESWLQAFSQGFFNLADLHHVQLIGGNMAHGPLSITVTALGHVPAGKALLRSTAKAGDLIYVSGQLGDAGFALFSIKNHLKNAHHEYFLSRLNRPEPRVATGLQLSHFAHAAIDISDGLAADLSHILTSSHVGAKVNVDALPISQALHEATTKEQALHLALTAGDDYELCFTVPKHRKEELENTIPDITCIGEIINKQGLYLSDQHGTPYPGQIYGYQHF